MKPRSRRSRVGWRVLAGCALVGLALLAAGEVLLRAYPRYLPVDAIRRLEFDQRRAADPRLIAHDDLGFVGPANDRHHHEGVDYDFVETTDEHGFRNPSPWPGQADIVVLGDSQAFAFGVDDDDTWTRLVDDALPGAEVVNLGLLGAAPQQYGRYYEAFGAPLEPELVIVALFPPNALYAGPLFEEWRQAGKPEGFNVWRAFGRPREDEPGLLDRAKPVLAHSRTILFVYGTLKQLRYPDREHQVSLDQGPLRLVPDLYAEDEHRARPGHPAFELVVDVLTALDEQVRADGSRMLVLLFPTKEEIHLPLLGEEAPALVDLFATELDRLGIPYLNLAAPFRQQAEQGRLLFLEIDLHPNVAGNRLIADALVEHLQRNLTAFGLTAPEAALRR